MSGNSNHIRVLPSVIVNRIAAGEVVERPSSVVKEMVENSLDAGATQIDILFQEGGKNLISISDNGFGMTKDDLELCILRHATSKLPDDDLFNIKNFGFRGEAIPSIASISRLKIASRKAGNEEAWEIYVDAGETKYIKPANINHGTVIEVSDLFYATPARLKFLKTDSTEKSKIVEVVNKIAMANPHCGFSLKEDGRKIFDYKPHIFAEEGKLARISEILGKDFQENCVAVDSKRGNAELTGFISLPTYNRSNSSYQFLFVNNRPVKDKVLLGAIRGAYMDFLARDRHAVTALFINIPSDEVDVNVHPAKAEVRFRFENEIRGLLVGSIKNALVGAGHRASNTLASDALSSFITSNNPHGFSDNDGGNVTSISDFIQPQKTLGERERNFYSSSFPSYKQNYKGIGNLNSSQANLSQKIFSPFELSPAAKFENEVFENTNSEADYKEFPLGAARAQIHENYIIAQTNDGLVIVDQHAAHERLTYEKMKKDFESKTIPTQKLLIPQIIELGESRSDLLVEKSQELRQFGFFIEKFGSNSISITELPEILKNENIQKLIEDIADDYSEYNQQITISEKIEHVLETIACHMSVRSGRRLNILEMNSLLRKMENTPHSGQCNHGRPTYIKLKLDDVEKLFGRK